MLKRRLWTLKPEPQQVPEIDQETEIEQKTEIEPQIEPEMELLETLTNLFCTIQIGAQCLKDLIYQVLLIPVRTIMQFLLSQDLRYLHPGTSTQDLL